MLFAVLAATAVLLLLGLAYQQIASIADRRRFADSTHLVLVPTGERLHIQCMGTGAPVVVLEAGIAATSLSWALVQPRVAEFTRVCSYDRAGLGRSDSGTTPASAKAHAATLDAMLRASNIPPPYVLAGHSYGSFVIRAYAQQHPDRVAGAVPRRSDPSGRLDQSWAGAATTTQRRRVPLPPGSTAGARRICAADPYPVDRRSAGGSAGSRAAVRLEGGGRAQPAGRRGPEAAAGELAARAGLLVSAQMLHCHGPSPGRSAVERARRSGGDRSATSRSL